jgi:hypothetical protein
MGAMIFHLLKVRKKQNNTGKATNTITNSKYGDTSR